MRILLLLFAATLAWAQPPSGNATKLRGKSICSTTPSDAQALVWSASNNCWQPGSASGGGGARALWNGNGAAAVVQAGVAATPFGLPSSNAPAATADADGTQAYLAFTANTAQTAYAFTKLPADWTGAAKLVLAAYSTSTNAPTINAYVACVSTGATTSPTYGSAQPVSLTPGAASGRTLVTTTLDTTGCSAGNRLDLKLVITAAAAANLNILEAQITE